MTALLRYLILPRELSPFEDRYLTRMNRVALWFFVAHLPLFVAIAAVNGTDPVQAAVLTAAVLLGPVVAVRQCPKRVASVVMGVAAMFMGGILAHIGQGPVQIEMHFYFFVLIALLAVFANPMVVVAAAVTAAAHHGLVWLVLPQSVFNYDAPVWVVGVHAAFVVLESVAACYIARSFFDNVVGLEKIIAARTAEVAARNQDMRMLLNSVDQGFFTVDRAGVVSDERSAAVDRYLGTVPPGGTLADLVRPHSPAVADWLLLGLDDVFGDLLPVEVTIDQLPRRLRSGERTFKLDYAPVPRAGPIEKLAVVVTDITAEVARERMEADHRVLMAMADRISRDKAGFLEFLQESGQLLAGLTADTTDDLAVVKRQVHTLKGNTAIFGLESVAAACHEVETHIAETGSLPAAAAWDAVHAAWATVLENVKRLVGGEETGVTLHDDEYAGILTAVLNNISRDEVARRVAGWRLEPTQKRMARIGDQAATLARRLGKGEVVVHTRGGELRTDPEQWGGFWSSFVHVVRNAVDHGLETPEERERVGKPAAGTIELATDVREGEFVVTIRDDGRGIDWTRVAAAAAAKGLPADTHEQLTEALFTDGLSTAEAVTETSGRGVGMGAVRAACDAHDGRISVVSTPGAGTTFAFHFPVESMARQTINLLARHGIRNPEESVLGNRTAAPSRSATEVTVRPGMPA